MNSDRHLTAHLSQGSKSSLFLSKVKPNIYSNYVWLNVITKTFFLSRSLSLSLSLSYRNRNLRKIYQRRGNCVFMLERWVNRRGGGRGGGVGRKEEREMDKEKREREGERKVEYECVCRARALSLECVRVSGAWEPLCLCFITIIIIHYAYQFHARGVSALLSLNVIRTLFAFIFHLIYVTLPGRLRWTWLDTFTPVSNCSYSCCQPPGMREVILISN